MKRLTKDERIAAFRELEKIPGVAKASTVFADRLNKAKLLIDHPHAYREWTVLGPAGDQGFYRLESSIRLGLDCYDTERVIYTRFELCLHETQFERL